MLACESNGFSRVVCKHYSNTHVTGCDFIKKAIDQTFIFWKVNISDAFPFHFFEQIQFMLLCFKLAGYALVIRRANYESTVEIRKIKSAFIGLVTEDDVFFAGHFALI